VLKYIYVNNKLLAAMSYEIKMCVPWT